VNENVFYEIRVQEQLDHHWSAWFEGLTLTPGEDNTTFLRGPVVDQAALYGLLDKTCDLGLTLLSVQRIDPGEAGWARVEGQEQSAPGDTLRAHQNRSASPGLAKG
jgi:hypothetical protein